jgi:hypothetical protein
LLSLVADWQAGHVKNILCFKLPNTVNPWSGPFCKHNFACVCSQLCWERRLKKWIWIMHAVIQSFLIAYENLCTVFGNAIFTTIIQHSSVQTAICTCMRAPGSYNHQQHVQCAQKETARHAEVQTKTNVISSMGHQMHFSRQMHIWHGRHIVSRQSWQRTSTQ